MTLAAIETYLDSLPSDRRQLVTTLSNCILTLFPDADVSMRYKMPTFDTDDGWLSVANQKHYVSLYTCHESYIAAFKVKHPAIKTGKGCINFNPRHALPTQDIADVILRALGSQ